MQLKNSYNAESLRFQLVNSIPYVAARQTFKKKRFLMGYEQLIESVIIRRLCT